MPTTLDRPALVVPPIVDDATRRDFIVVGTTLAALLATGCASNDDQDSSRETRPVETDFGAVDVPVRPQRVITTYTDTLDIAVALDLPLVASPGARGSSRNPFPPFLPADRLTDVDRLDTYPDQSVESLAAARPDLILNSFPDRELHDQLTALAPTVTIAPVAGRITWQDIIGRLAGALGREDIAAEFVRTRRDRIGEVSDAIAGSYAGATFAAGGIDAEGFFGLYGDDISPSPILTELGLRNLATAPTTGVERISIERLGDLGDAGVIFVTGNPPEGGYEPDLAAQAVVRDSALWRALPAVTAGAIVDLPVDLVFPGPFCDQALLDLIQARLA